MTTPTEAAAEFVKERLVYDPDKGERVSRHQLCGWLEVEEGKKPTAGPTLLPKFGAFCYSTVQKAAKKLGDDAEVKPGTKQKKTSYLTNVRLLGKLVL